MAIDHLLVVAGQVALILIFSATVYFALQATMGWAFAENIRLQRLARLTVNVFALTWLIFTAVTTLFPISDTKPIRYDGVTRSSGGQLHGLEMHGRAPANGE